MSTIARIGAGLAWPGKKAGEGLEWIAGSIEGWSVARFIKAIEPAVILIAIVAFAIELGDRQEERSARAWQLLTARAPGNSGKIQALEYLNKEDHEFFRGWGSFYKKRVSLSGIDLSPPSLATTAAPGASQCLAPCWSALEEAACSHQAIRTGSGRQAARMASFKWVNTTLGNIKSAITGTYRKLGPDHAGRYLASFAWRYNRRDQLQTMIPRFVHSAAVVADDDGILEQAMGDHAAPQRAFGGDLQRIGMHPEPGDAEALEIGHPRLLVFEALAFVPSEPATSPA